MSCMPWCTRAFFCKQVAILQRMDAMPSTLWTGEPYTSKGLQNWKAGLAHTLDLQPCILTDPGHLCLNDYL